jgi:hypothetical protein
MKNLEKKIRIQTFDPEFSQIEDRLIGQDLELRSGPKIVHEGPLKVEVCLFQQEDVQLFKDYLDRLMGNLPLEAKKTRGRKIKMGSPTFNEDFIESFKEVSSVDEFNTLLEKTGFVATSTQLLRDLEIPISIPEDIDMPKYRLLIRMLKKAKNPLNNKYDPTLIILVPRKKGEDVLLIYHGEIEVTQSIDKVSSSKVRVAKSLMTSFPPFMTQDERNKFRVEKEKLDKNPEAKPSRFYARWVHYVADENEGKGITFPRLEEIERPY